VATRFGVGLLDSLPAMLRELAPSSVVTIADPRVIELHGWPLSGGERLPVAGGEAGKNLVEWQRLIDALVEIGADRECVVVAFGGGTTLDLAGFVAAAYLRGIRWICVPTTLLAQVDAAHGGKTGVDLPAAKNLVGAFHPPESVLCDTNLLATLPEREVAGGLAEVVKHGVIAGAELLRRAGRDEPAALVAAAARVKLGIVERDPLERGERRVLNLGHTLGHAFERASDYTLHHGEAVALGLRAACAIATSHCNFGEGADVEAALDRCALPRTAALSVDAVRAALRHDKKRRGKTLRWVLPVRIGDVRIYEDVPDELVASAIRDVCGS